MRGEQSTKKGVWFEYVSTHCENAQKELHDAARGEDGISGSVRTENLGRVRTGRTWVGMFLG